MKKYFTYELKRNWLTLTIITVFSCIIYIAAILNMEFIYDYEVKEAINPPIFIPTIILSILCTIIPILLFSFKMKSRQVDYYYSLPLKRQKIYFIKALIGLIMVLIPYTICYWLGFLVVITKPNIFELWVFIPMYFISLPLAILLFGINTFIFTRANHLIDGIIFITLYACAIPLLVGYIDMKDINFLNSYYDFSYWFTYSPLTWLNTCCSNALIKNFYAFNIQDLIMIIYTLLIGIGSWLGLFMIVKKEKAEKAGSISDSNLGYCILIPYYMLILLLLCDYKSYNFIIMVMVIIGSIIFYMIYRRGVKLRKRDIISLVTAFVLSYFIAFL